MYHALKGQHLTFSTHYQPYPHHTPNALDLLPKWLHGSEIQKSRKVDFSTFSSNPSKFRFLENFLVASTIRALHNLMYWVMFFQTHYQSWLYNMQNEMNPLLKWRRKTQNQENPHFGQIDLKKSSKTLNLDFKGIFFSFS